MEKAPGIVQETLAQAQPPARADCHLLAGVPDAGFEPGTPEHPDAPGAATGPWQAAGLLSRGHRHDQAGGPLVRRSPRGTECLRRSRDQPVFNGRFPLRNEAEGGLLCPYLQKGQ